MVAAVDAVRSRDAGEPPAATATTELLERAPLAGQAALLGVRGELLLYGDGCSVERLELPSLVLDPIEGACWPRGTRSPSGEVVAVCRGETTEVYSTVGSFQNSHLGCTPAWQTGGTLTLSRHGEVVTPDGTVLIPSSELERAARRHPTVPDALTRVRALVDGIAWLSNTTAAVLLSIRVGGRLDRLGPLSAIAFFENGRLARTQPYFRVTRGRLGASPRGTYVTQTPDVILRRDGSQVSLPRQARDGHAFAWSEDERFLAIATPSAVTIVDVTSLARFDRIGSGLRSVTLPLSAQDLVWR